MTRRQDNDLLTIVAEEWIGSNQQGFDIPRGERREGVRQCVCATNTNYNEVAACSFGSGTQILLLKFNIRAVRVHQSANHCGRWRKLAKYFEALGVELSG